MDIMSILTFIFIATLLVISSGPGSILIAKIVLLSGIRSGFSIVLVFLIALYIHGILSIFGISILLVKSPKVFLIVKLLGAVYLCWIGLKSFWSAWGDHEIAQLSLKVKKEYKGQHGAFTEVFLTNLLNQKVSIFYIDAFPQYLSVDESIARAYILVSAHAMVSLLWFSTLVILTYEIKGVVSTEKKHKLFKYVVGIFL